MHNGENNPEVLAIDVFLERRKSREKVGRLTKIKTEGRPLFEFKYSEDYLLKGNSIPLGPEFPLTQEEFNSRKLFPSFEDRIPSKKNPAYVEYCKAVGISPDETNPLILLSTIGRKGPSSFIFEAVKNFSELNQGIAEYRKRLGLTIREFAAIFGASTTSIQQIEHGKNKGKELIKRLNIYVQFPEVAKWEANNNRSKIHDDKYKELQKRLSDL